MGFNTTAMGSNATAIGFETTASGNQATAMGSETEASGLYSTAMGNNTLASATNSTAMRENSLASGNTSTAMGKNTTASGSIATAMGFGTTASGLRATAMGNDTTASESYATAMGNDTEASATNSTAMGNATEASGSTSTAIGRSTIAPSYVETSIGSYNTEYTPNNQNGFDSADRVITIGNGSFSLRSNALTIFKSGLMNINDEYNMPLTDGTAGQVMTTDGLGNVTFQTPSGGSTSASNGLTEVGNDIRLGGNLIQDTNINYGNFDTRFNLNGAGDFIVQDNGTGVFSIDSNGNTNVGNNMQWRENAINGTLIVEMLEDDNDGRFIVRENGNISVDFQTNTGFIFNEQGADRDFRIESDDVQNMFRVDAANNRTGVRTDTPDGMLDIEGNSSSSLAHLEITENNDTDGGRIKFKNTVQTNNHWILYGRSRDVAADSRFNINHSTAGNVLIATGAGNVGIRRTPTTNDLEVNGTASKSVAGNWLANSDRRLKTKIQTIETNNALDKLLALRGVTYEWNDTQTGIERPLGTQYGFIAQELMQVFPEKVSVDGQGFYQTAYGDYDALFVQAIKELNTKVETLKKENEDLKSKLNQLESLEARLNALEENNKTSGDVAAVNIKP